MTVRRKAQTAAPRRPAARKAATARPAPPAPAAPVTPAAAGGGGSAAPVARTRAGGPGRGRTTPAVMEAPEGQELLDLYIAELRRMPVLSALEQKDLARVM